MGISVNTSKQQITAAVSDEAVTATVSAGIGASGAAGTAATITVGTVTTGAPGSSAVVTNAGSSSAAVLNFTIPAGATGATGATGPAGTTTWAGITDKPSTFTPSSHTHTFAESSTTGTYVNFLTTPGGGDLADALSGIDGAISGKAAASHAHGNIASDGKVTAAGNINQSHSIVIANADGDLTVVSQVSAQDIATVNGGSNTSLYADIQDLTVAVLGLPTTYAALSHTHSASDTTSGTFDIARIPTGTSSTTVSLGNHTHSQLHDRSHAITSTDDHTAGNWKVFYSNGSGQVVELALGSSGQYLTANGTSAAPTFTTPSSGGSTNVWIPASAFIPRTTNGPGVDSRETSTNKQNFDEVLFDAAAIEYADALVILPSNYNNSTVTARFYWTAASGSGDVVFAIAGRAFANDDALDTAYGTAQSATDTLLAANDMHVSAATSAMTLGGTPAANTPAQFTVYRDATNAGDTLAVDARLLGVEIIYTAA